MSVDLALTRMELTHLADLVRQLADLVEDTPPVPDPAIERLTPDVYPDDEDASRQFRSVTRADLLHRRGEDARVVLHDLDRADRGTGDELAAIDVSLAGDSIAAWMRTLASLRLVIATRLGITQDDERDPDDARFGVYDWLGFRLEGLVQAADQER